MFCLKFNKIYPSSCYCGFLVEICRFENFGTKLEQNGAGKLLGVVAAHAVAVAAYTNASRIQAPEIQMAIKNDC